MRISSRVPRSCWRCGSLGRTRPKEPETSEPSQGWCRCPRLFLFICLSPRQVSLPAAGCPPPARARGRAACLAPLRHFIQHTSTRFNATNCVWSLYVPPATTKLSPDFSNRMDLRSVDGWRAVFSPQALEAASLQKMATSPCTVARRR